MADSDLCSTSQWIQFFRNAGLPPNVAANYALIFSDNRIQQNMLMDLSKEYLYDMGIKVMGDVIAILRYSKEFHNQLAKERIMGSESSLSTPLKRSSPASRMLGHYTRPTPTVAKGSPQKRVLNLSKASLAQEGNVKKIRRVLPEEEGSYKIKMPAGTTERTRKILEQQTLLASKKSVFERLGDSDVSSSTDVKRSVSSGSVFNRLGPSTSEVSTSSDQSRDQPLTYRGVLKPTKQVKKVITLKRESNVGSADATRKAPVVKRLGSKPTVQTKRTVVNNCPRTHGVMQINSILQQNAQLNAVTRRPLGTSLSLLGRSQAVSRTSITRRLGAKNNAVVTSNQSLRNKPIVLKRNPIQHNRLQQSSVFNRLGK